MAAELSPVRAWTTAVSVIPKRGMHSVGVHRRFVAETGRTLNCQVAIGLFLSTADRSIPVDWRILLDDSWLGDDHRRRRARIPASITPRPEWTHVLDFADHIASRHPLTMAPLVVDLRAVADAGPLAAAFTRRGLDFVLEVGPAQPVLPAPDQPGRPGYRSGRGATVTTAGEFLSRGNAGQSRIVTTPGRSPQSRPVIVYTGLVRLPQAIGVAGRAPGVYRLLGEWSPITRGVGRYWITSLVDRCDGEILSFARHFGHAKVAVQDLKDRFGLLDFEGRSFPGWHHHMTMVSAAYAYSRLCRAAHRDEMVDEDSPPGENMRRPLRAIQ